MPTFEAHIMEKHSFGLQMQELLKALPLKWMDVLTVF